MTFAPEGRRVVVTGLGAVTPLGTDVPTYWRRLVAGESGIGPITAFDASGLASRIAGEVEDFDPSIVLDRKEIRRNDRATQMALVATREAMDDAGLPTRLEGQTAEMTGVLIGSGLGGTNTLIDQIAICRIEGPNRVSPFFIPMAIANMPAGVVGHRLRRHGTQLFDHQRLRLIGTCARRVLRDHPAWRRRHHARRRQRGTGGRCHRGRLLAHESTLDPQRRPQPPRAGRSTPVVTASWSAEGAATLVLEELGHAQRRGAQHLRRDLRLRRDR